MSRLRFQFRCYAVFVFLIGIFCQPIFMGRSSGDQRVGNRSLSRTPPKWNMLESSRPQLEPDRALAFSPESQSFVSKITAVDANDKPQYSSSDETPGISPTGTPPAETPPKAKKIQSNPIETLTCLKKSLFEKPRVDSFCVNGKKELLKSFLFFTKQTEDYFVTNNFWDLSNYKAKHNFIKSWAQNNPYYEFYKNFFIEEKVLGAQVKDGDYCKPCINFMNLISLFSSVYPTRPYGRLSDNLSNILFTLSIMALDSPSCILIDAPIIKGAVEFLINELKLIVYKDAKKYKYFSTEPEEESQYIRIDILGATTANNKSLRKVSVAICAIQQKNNEWFAYFVKRNTPLRDSNRKTTFFALAGGLVESVETDPVEVTLRTEAYEELGLPVEVPVNYEIIGTRGSSNNSTEIYYSLVLPADFIPTINDSNEISETIKIPKTILHHIHDGCVNRVVQYKTDDFLWIGTKKSNKEYSLSIKNKILGDCSEYNFNLESLHFTTNVEMSLNAIERNSSDTQFQIDF